ncbi:MAG: tRNA pseudouridine(55) synthase TruB [Rhodospirillaceae bacterium]|nr:tRNA pseudouridine(55) synthase TruB [Rhodospirillaceae bacterium]
MKSKSNLKKRRDINGILLLDKPLGLTSNSALQKVKWLFHAAKAGHTGSLDPLATGMLPICFGSGTKVSSFLLDADKRYLVTGEIGIATESGDAEGKVIQVNDNVTLHTANVKDVLDSFIGHIEQIPPMYSALRHKGRRLYELAREGTEVDRVSREVTIYDIQLKDLTQTKFTIEVHCSKGTYIRTLIEDISKALGTVGFVTKLRRLVVAPFSEDQMIKMECIEECSKLGTESLDSLLCPVDSALTSWSSVQIDKNCCKQFCQGQSIKVGLSYKKSWVRVYSSKNEFIGMGEIRSKGQLIPRRIFSCTG